MHTHTNKMAITLPAFVSAFWKWNKGECENEWAREKKPRMRCVIHPRHGGWGQLGDKTGLPIVHTCHTHTHMSDRKQAPPQQNPICCKICQRKVKMSVNWGYFIHLSLTASHLLSSLCQLWWGFIPHSPRRCHQKSKWGTGSWNYFWLNLLLFWHRFLITRSQR